MVALATSMSYHPALNSERPRPCPPIHLAKKKKKWSEDPEGANTCPQQHGKEMKRQMRPRPSPHQPHKEASSDKEQ